jgi:signal transduction histidine kinase
MESAPATRSGEPGASGWSRLLPGWLRRAWTEQGGDWRPPIRDIAVAVVITVIAVVAAYGEAHPTNPSAYFTGTHHLPYTPTAALLIVVAGGAALAWRHRYPRLVVCLTTAATVAYTLPGYVNGVVLLLPAIALVTVATKFPVRQSVAWALAVTIVLMAATAANNPLGGESGGFWIIPANDAVALFVGIAIANRSYVQSARIQAARQATLDAQRRIDEERVRIARELHDVVAHTMATITVQAAAATQLLRDRPDEAAESLKAIRAASKDGLRELRAILEVLRTATGGADEPADPTQPTPGLNRLDALVTGVRAAGLPVTVTLTGTPRDLPAVTDLSAFRIIQEALTNTLRHAGPASAAVTVDYGESALRVEVTDTGRGLTDSAAEAAYAAFIINAGFPVAAPAAAGRDPLAAPPGPGTVSTGGHGLRGMRERAAAAGGTIDIGPRPGGGFRVAATLPLDPGPGARTGARPDPRSARTAPTQQAENTEKASR